MGAILDAAPWLVAGAGSFAIAGGIVGSGFRPLVSVHGSWWRKLLVGVGVVAGAMLSFAFWPDN